MRVVVPDASVILKWVLPPHNEQNVEQALALRSAIARQEVQGIVPALWYFEVGNILARNYPDEAAGHLQDLRKFRLIGVLPDGDLEQQILRLTETCRVTFYDASSHALAIHRAGVFVTADENYLEAAAAVGHLLPLKDWPLTSPSPTA